MSEPKIKQAMVLAAGLGKRLRPLTETIPKPLLPVSGKPLIQNALEALSQFGVERIVINTHYLADQIESYINTLNQQNNSPELIISRESTLLETGGGILNAQPHFKNGPIISINSDIWWEDTTILDRLTEKWNSQEMDALLAIVPLSKALNYSKSGDFILGADSRLSRINPSSDSTHIYTGIQIINPERLLRENSGSFPLSECYQRSLNEKRLFGVETEGSWSDLGTLEAYTYLRDFKNFS